MHSRQYRTGFSRYSVQSEFTVGRQLIPKSANSLIRAKGGRLEFSGSDELAVRHIARYLKISVDDLEERMRTPTERQAKRDLLKLT